MATTSNRYSYVIDGDAAALVRASAQGDAAVRKLGGGVQYTRQQMQNLSFQMTDIAVSLGSGQSPLTVLLQQGGQLKDAFGGVGGAARALATGVSSMINPITVGAAAIGALALAAIEGYKESVALRNSLALTGNFANVTGESFGDLADRVSAATNTTIGNAREIAQGFVSSGQLSGAALETLTDAAARVAKVSGDSADSIVKDFLAMNGGVAKWAEEHNKAWHFVSSAQLDYIRQLEDQGNKEAAMVEVGRLVRDHLKGVQQDLTTAERLWGLVDVAASRAWQHMKDPFAGFSAQATAAALRAQVALDSRSAAFETQRGISTTPQAMAERAARAAELEAMNRDALRVANRGIDSLGAAQSERDSMERKKALKEITDQLTGANSEYAKSLKTIQAAAAAGDITEEQRLDLLRMTAEKYGQKAAKPPKAKTTKLDYYGVDEGFIGPMLPSPTGPNIDPDLLRQRERAPEELQRFAEQMKRDTAELNISLIADDRARSEAQLELERQTAQGRLEILKASGADIAAAQAALDANINTKRAKTEEEFAKDRELKMRGELSGTLRDAMEGDFKSIGDRWSQLLVDMAADAVAADLTRALFSGAMGAGGSGGGWLDALGSIAFDVLGGSKFADGGLHSGGLRLVGERGPELEVTGPARYFNARQTEQMLAGAGSGSGGGGITINIPQTINVGQGVQRAEMERAARLARDSAVAEIEKRLERGNRRWDR